MRDLQSYVDEEYRKGRNAPENAMRLYDGKTIHEAFPPMLKSQLESRLDKLEASRRAMLHERSGIITNIQKDRGQTMITEDPLERLALQ